MSDDDVHCPRENDRLPGGGTDGRRTRAPAGGLWRTSGGEEEGGLYLAKPYSAKPEFAVQESAKPYSAKPYSAKPYSTKPTSGIC